MPTYALRPVAWFCALSCTPWVSAQTAPPTGNPLNTLPQIQTPQPVPAAPVLMPDAELQLSKRLTPKLELSTLITTQRIDIAGVQAIPFEEVAALFQPLAGKQVTLEQLALAVQQATQLYQKAGFPLSFVYLPDQNFNQGIVRVRAVEGHVQQVNIQGNVGRSEALLREVAQPIVEDRPLQGDVFTRQTLIMARMLHLQVKAQVNLPQTTDGATPLLLEVEQQPVEFNLSGDFTQSNPKAIANLTLNDALWAGSQWQFAALLENPDKERFVSAAWNQWLTAQGTTMRLSFSDFKGKDNYAFGQINDITTQRKLEWSVSHPWKLAAQTSTIVGASIYGLNYGKSYEFPNQNVSYDSQEKVRAAHAYLQWQKTGMQSSQNAKVAITQGINSLGAGQSQSAGLAANAMRFDFSRLNMDYELRWRFKSLWGAAFAVSGQASAQTLPTSERVSFGSWRFGRAYQAGEATGDRGIGTSVEVNRLIPFPNRRWVKSLEPYLLYEYAHTRFHRNTYASQTLRSSSFGVRFGDQRTYALDLSVSKPQGDKSLYNTKRSVRYSLSLTYQFDL